MSVVRVGLRGAWSATSSWLTITGLTARRHLAQAVAAGHSRSVPSRWEANLHQSAAPPHTAMKAARVR